MCSPVSTHKLETGEAGAVSICQAERQTEVAVAGNQEPQTATNAWKARTNGPKLEGIERTQQQTGGEGVDGGRRT